MEYKRILSKMIKFIFSISFAAVLSHVHLFPQSVGPDGSLSHQIPIQLPPGLGGLVPSLSLVYNSNSGNGKLGVGWSLAGLPIITKINNGKGINYDGYDSNDTYAGPGGKLVAIEDGTFRTEVESWAKYIPYGSCGSDQCYWIMTDKSGIKYYFGYKNDSRIEAIGKNDQVRVWAIDKIEDTHGNKIEIGYDENQGEYYPTKIFYSSGESMFSKTYINFVWENRIDYIRDFSQNVKVTTNKRLKEIIINKNAWGSPDFVLSSGTQVRRYELNYNYSNSTGRSQLYSVQEFGSDNSFLPPMTFKWQDPGYVFNDLNSLIQISENNGYGPSVVPGDFNGDGKTDLIFVEDSGDIKNIKITYGGSSFGSYTPLGWGLSKNRLQGYKIWPGDFNGDGKTDIIFYEEGSPIGISYGGNLQTYGRLANIMVQNNFLIGPSLWPADYDGDGKTDILIANDDNGSLVISYGKDNFSHTVSLTWGVSKNGLLGYKIWPGDYDGDGKTDILIFEKDKFLSISYGMSGHSTPVSLGYMVQNNLKIGPSLWTGDFNGDGLTDIIFANDSPGFYNYPLKTLFISYGGDLSYKEPLDWGLARNNLKGYQVEIGDFDGDRRSDILFYEEGSPLGISYGRNLNTFTRVPWSITSDDTIVPLIWLGDFDGNGKTDVIIDKNGYKLNQTDLIFYEQGHNLGLSYTGQSYNYERLNWYPSENGGTGPVLISGNFDDNRTSDIIFIEDGHNAGISYDNNLNEYSRLNWTMPKHPEFGYRYWSGDFDGDGKTDILIWEDESVPMSIVYGKNILNKEQLTWSISSNIISSTLKYGPMGWLGDFNGDGRTDFIFFEAGHNLGISYGGSLNTYNRLNFTLPNNYKYGPIIWIGDFDGNDKSDILIYKTSFGFSDNLYVRYGEYLNCSLENCFFFEFPIGWSIWDYSYEYEGTSVILSPKIWIGDFNADGKDDILSARVSGMPLNISYGGNLNIRTSLSWWVGPSGKFGPKIWIGDFDGDQKADILFHEPSQSLGISYGDDLFHYGRLNFGISDNGIIGPVVSLGNYTNEEKPNHPLDISYSISENPDLLTTLNNGIGGKTVITYNHATSIPNAIIPSNTSYPKIANSSSRNLVTRISFAGDISYRNDGAPEAYDTTFEYYNGMYKTGTVPERKNCGFQWKKETTQQGSYSITYYEQDTADIEGAVKLVENYNRDNQLLSTQSIEYTTTDKPKDENGYILNNIKFIYSHFNRKMSYESGTYLSSSDNYLIYDNRNGNVSEVKNVTSNQTTIISTFGYEQDATNKLIWHLTSKQIKDPGGTYYSKERYIYNSNCSDAGIVSLCDKEVWLDYPSEKWLKTSFLYDSIGRVKKLTDPLLHSTDMLFSTNSTGNVQEIKNVVNTVLHKIIKVYDSGTGQLVSETNENGHEIRLVYDSFGRRKSVFNADNVEIQKTSYNAFGASGLQHVRTEIKDDSGNDGVQWSEVYFDGLGRKYKTVSEGGEAGKITVDYKFNSSGQLESETNAYMENISGKFYTTFQYDSSGRVIYVQSPAGNTRTEYFGSSPANWYAMQIRFTDAKGNQKLSTYDTLGRVLEVAEAGYVSYEYTAIGQLKKTIDADHNSTTITYDSLGRKTSLSPPSSGTWYYRYDDAGNLNYQSDPIGQIIKFEYDSINRITKTDYSSSVNGKDTNVEYYYDNDGMNCSGSVTNGIGQICKITDASGSTEYTQFNKFGNPLEWKKALTGYAKSFVFKADYDVQGRLLNMTYPDGESIRNYYSDAGNLRQVRLFKKDESIWGSPVVTYSHANASNIITRKAGNGVLTDISYDAVTQRPTSVITKLSNGTPVQDLSYKYDAAGNLGPNISEPGIKDNLDDNKSQYFEYDSLNRLVKANSVLYGNLSYQYSKGGNLTVKEGVNLNYSNPSLPQAVYSTSAGDLYSYDANGNMTSRNGRNLFYDSEDRLVSIEASGNEKYKFTYDFSGERVKKERKDLSNTDGYVAYSIGGLYEVQIKDGVDANEYHTKYIYGLAGDRAAQITRVKTSGDLIAGAGTLETWNIASTYGVTGIKTFILSFAYKTYKHFSTTKTDIRLYLFVFFIFTLIVFVFRNHYSGKIQYTHFLQHTTPGVLIVFLFVFVFNGCSVKNDPSTNPIGTEPWSDVAATPIPGSSENIQDVPAGADITGTYFDTTTSAIPVTGVFFYHPNHLGSTALVSNHDGTAIISEIHYKPYGEVVRGTTGSPTASSGPDIFRHKYTGQEDDADTSLMYYGARYYDPKIGRFISADTVVPDPFSSQSFNRYMYVSGNPVNYNDPSGNKGCDWWNLLCHIDNSRTKDPPPQVTDSNGNGGKNSSTSLCVGFGSGGLYIGLCGGSDLNRYQRPPGGSGPIPTSTEYGPDGRNSSPSNDVPTIGGEPTDSFNSKCPGYSGPCPSGGGDAPSTPSSTDDSGDTPWYVYVGAGIVGIGAGVGTYLFFSSDNAVPAGVAAGTATVNALSNPTIRTGVSRAMQQMHHFATNKHSAFTPLFKEIASKYGLSLNAAWNKALMTHMGRHPHAYHRWVLKNMQKAAREAGKSSKKFLELFNKYISQPVSEDPNMLRKWWWE